MEATERYHIDRRAPQVAAAGQGEPDDLLSTEQLAKWFGTTIQFVERLRASKRGPKAVRIGRKAIRYRRKDVLAWLDERAVAFEKRK